MLYLVIAILFGSLFSVMLKICQQWKVDTLQVILFNYVFAFLITLAPILYRMIGPGGGIPVQDFVLSKNSIGACVLQGLLFLAGFYTMDRGTFHCGVALTTAAARAALVLPVLLSWMLLDQPAPSWIAVGLILASMALIVLPAEDEEPVEAVPAGKSEKALRRTAALALVAVFLAYGFSDFMLKIAQHSVERVSGDNPALMANQMRALTCTIFLMASVFGLLLCLAKGSFRKHKVTWRSLVGGLALGLINIGCTSCVLKALGVLPTGTFYPLYNIGIVILATLIGVIFFKEKLKWLQVGGLALAIAAIALAF